MWQGVRLSMLALLVRGLTSLVGPGKPVTNQVTTPSDPCGQHRTQPDTAFGLTCGYQTSWDPGRRNRPAWHASSDIPARTPHRRENPGRFLLSADGVAAAPWLAAGAGSGGFPQCRGC